MATWRVLTWVLPVMIVAAMTGPGSAQINPTRLNPSTRPAFSPYLNLNRAGTSTAVNYYGIVRPEISFNNSIYQLGQQQQALAAQQLQQDATLSAVTLPPTGHVTGFMTHNRYFMTSTGATTSPGAVAGPTGRPAPTRSGGAAPARGSSR